MPNNRTISTHTFPPMSRYRGPRLRITRRLGDLPGLTRKAAKRSYPPGQHGQARRKRSEYAIRLEEKQKLRFNYGVSERQLVRYVKKARAQEGSTGTNLSSCSRIVSTMFVSASASVPPCPAPVSW